MSYNPLAIGDGSVTNKKLAKVPAGTVKGNLTSKKGYPEDVTLEELAARVATSSPSGLTVRKNSASVGTRGQVNFIEGSNVTLTVADDGTEIDVTIASSAASSGANGVYATVDFGSTFTHVAEVTVTGETWVAADSKIAVTPLTTSTDRYEIALLGFQPVVSDLVAGDGFTLTVYSPIEAKGSYTFSCLGT